MADEELALNLYINKTTSDRQVLEAIKGTPLKFESMKMKISNIRFLDTGFGLKNAPNQTKKLFKEYKNSLTA
tara:strand:- start:39821 stop:40036 length:216 start_codon:yes stop_codon:yes gene_type:complete